MLALWVDWHGRPIDPPTIDRMADVLGADTGRVVRRHDLAPGLFAATMAPAACVTLARGRTLLFHGHLQNRADLRAALAARGAEDADLYAEACERWGDAADLRVVGEYVAALVDAQARTVRLTRSPIQAPPLRCHRTPGGLVAGSTARVIFASGVLAPRVDDRKIADSLYLNYAEPQRDWYEGVERLPNGCAATHTPVRATLSRYHDLADLPRVRLRGDDAYLEAASALFAEGTRAALDGRSRPAIALSGGLDSQAVAVQAMAVLPRGTQLLGLTGVPEAGWESAARPGAVGDERASVAALSARYPTLRTGSVDAAGRSFHYRLPDMFRHAGGPPRNASNLHWLHDLQDRAHAEGCDVLLTGALGNFSFSFDGEGALAGWLARGRWWRLGREVARMDRKESLARVLVRNGVRPNLPRAIDARITRWRTAGAPLPPWCPLAPEYARAMQVVERAGDPGSAASTRTWRLSMLYEETGESGDLNQAMETIHGVPLRDPTAYRPFVEFCLGIPDEQFWKGGVRRRLARRMLRGKVPDATVDERRTGEQGADWRLRLRRDREALRAEIAALAADPSIAHRLDLPRLAAALDGNWDEPPTSAQRQTLQLALPRALATAAFIRWVEAGNA